MEYSIRVAKAKFSELVGAAAAGERVVITKHGRPIAELVRYRDSGCIDFEQLAVDRREAGIGDPNPDWPDEFDNPEFSRRMLDLD